MVWIQYLVAIQGCDPNRNPDCNSGRNPGRNLRSRMFQGFRIEIATLIATLVETSVPERFRVANRDAIRVTTLNRNPETTRFRFFLKIETLGVFYGFDYGFCFDRNLLKVFPGSAT